VTRLTTDKGPLSSHNGSIFPGIWAAVAVQVDKIRAERDAKLKARVEVSAPLSMGMAAE
jgi:hypothetical protein